MFWKNIISRSKSLYSAFTKGTDYQYLSFFRIAIGLVALTDLATMYYDFGYFFSENETIVPQELTYLFTEYFGYLNPFYNYLEESGNLGLFYSWSLWLYVGSLLLLIAGIFTRFSAVLALLFQLLIFKSFAVFNYGYDQFMTMSLFYCIIFPVGKIYSIDNLILRRPSGLKYSFDYQKVLRIHLCLVYFFAGVAKLVAVTWWNGEAVWRSISTIYDNYFTINPVILAAVGIFTVILETGYPLLVSFKYTRKITLILVILMHLSIAVIMQLPIFAAIMIVWNITAFYNLLQRPERTEKKIILQPL